MEPIKSIPVAAQSSAANQLRVSRILQGNSAKQERCLFDIQLENSSAKQITLNEFHVSWRYQPGALSSVSHGELLNPLSAYTIYLNIDPMNLKEQKQSHPVYPTVVLLAGTPASPSVVLLRLEFIFKFSGEMKYHPASDWNVSSSLTLRTTDGVEIPVFIDKLWRN